MMTCCYGKKFLITGGCGFLGYHIIKKLLNLGATVSVIDIVNCSKKRIDEFLSKLKIHYADITDYDSVKEIVSDVNPDYVIHLVGYGVNSKDNDIEKAISINIIGGTNIVKALVGTDCKKIVNIGSSAEYGNKTSKDDETLCPLNIYGSTKAAATIIMHQIARSNSLGIITLRPFNIYGEWEEPHKLFCDVIVNLLKFGEINVTGCQQERDYVYAGDVAQAIIMAALCKETDEIMDIASGESKTLKHYIEAIAKSIGETCKINYGVLPYRKNEVFKHCANSEKIFKHLGWKPVTRLDEGTDIMLSWFKNNLQHYL